MTVARRFFSVAFQGTSYVSLGYVLLRLPLAPWVIGALVGVWQSYTFFVTDQTFGAIDFQVPAVEILLILVGSYLATLVTTYLPSRAAAQVAPAEALRYE